MPQKVLQSTKLAVVTGANSGIGFEMSKALAALGMYVVMVCRDEMKGLRAVAEVKRAAANESVELVLCDFSIMSDIKQAASEISNRFSAIDILINNAGFIASKRETTIDGFESTFAVNHLGYFLFSGLLDSLIRKAPAGRIINVASEAHRVGKFDPENLQLETGFTPMKAYGNSKLFNILFTKELNRKLEGSAAEAFCFHPGVVRTGFASGASALMKLGVLIARPFMVSPQAGASTGVYLATSQEVSSKGGGYFKNRKPAKPASAAQNMDSASRLWQISEELLDSAI